MELGKRKAETSKSKALNQKLTETVFTNKPVHGLHGSDPGIGPMNFGKQNVRVLCETSRLTNTQQASPEECGIKPLTFTFVPSVRRLPAHSQVLENSKSLFQSAQKPTRETNQANKSNVASKWWTFESGISKDSGLHLNYSHNKHSHNQGKEAAFNKLDEMEENDIFQAEFVFVMDSDDEGEETTSRNKNEKPIISSNEFAPKSFDTYQTSNGEADLAKPTVVKLNVSAPQLPELFHGDTRHQRYELTSSSTTGHISCTPPAINVVSPTNQRLRLVLQDQNQVSSPEDSSRMWHSATGFPVHSSSTCLKTSGFFPPSSIKQQTSIPQLSTIRKPSNTQLTITPQRQTLNAPKPVHSEHEKKTEASGNYSPTLRVANICRDLSPSPHPQPSSRSGTLSPIPAHIITHSLCPHPKPLSSHLCGSSSTIGSTDELCSPMSPRRTLSKTGSSSSLPTRLSFLTAILKSGRSTDRRTDSPTPYLSKLSSKSLSSLTYTFCQKPNTTETFSSSVPTGKLGDFQSTTFDQSHKQSRTLPLSLGLNNLSPPSHAPYHSPLQPHKTLNPYLVSPKPFTMLSTSRQRVMSPVLRQRSHSPRTPSPNSARRSPSPFNLKPPINKEPKQLFKKCAEPGKIRRDRTPSPTVSSCQSQSLTSSGNQRANNSPAPEKYLPSNLFSPAYSKVVSTPLPIPRLIAASHTPSHAPSSWSNSISPLLVTHNTHPHSPQLKSFSLPPNYRAYSSSPNIEQSSSASITQCMSPVPMQSSPYTALSRSSELSSAQSFSQSPDNETKNPKQYKITSRYKAFAAIPTNTLLMDQKALDEPVKTSKDGDEDILDTHSDLCLPAQLRQQTEEVCADIDQVLQDPPLKDSSTASAQLLCDSRSKQMPSSLPRAAGRETKYAAHCSPVTVPTKTEQTRPGVIRPLPLKPTIIMKSEEAFYINPFQ